FLASIIPGLIVSLLFVVIIYTWCSIDPSLGPRGEKSSWGARIASIKGVAGVTGIFIVVMGGLLMGFFTPTEAGSVGAFAVGLLAFATRDINFTILFKSLRESLLMACMVLILIAGSTIFGHFITVTKIPMVCAEWILQLPFPSHTILILIGFVYILGGTFIDDLAFMILATPIFYPIVAKLGYDLIWFGIFIQITVMIGSIIPPVAINVFVIRSVTKDSFSDIYKGVTPFLISLILVIICLFLFPQVALFIPSLLAAN
ncbi:MAG: TRAP transporter large permease subunit, partial [Deltaproteobacteria bacterium]|nr:TRAP transporter large permease subunit [Deltaproteobacteria bacterium]